MNKRTPACIALTVLLAGGLALGGAATANAAPVHVQTASATVDAAIDAYVAPVAGSVEYGDREVKPGTQYRIGLNVQSNSTADGDLVDAWWTVPSGWTVDKVERITNGGGANVSWDQDGDRVTAQIGTTLSSSSTGYAHMYAVVTTPADLHNGEVFTIPSGISPVDAGDSISGSPTSQSYEYTVAGAPVRQQTAEVTSTDDAAGTATIGGVGEIGETITVSDGTNTHTVTVGTDGKWSLDLTGLSGETHLTISQPGSEDVPLTITMADTPVMSAGFGGVTLALLVGVAGVTIVRRRRAPGAAA